MRNLTTSMGVLLALLAAGGAAAGEKGAFGSKDPGLYNLKGSIYFLSEQEAENGMPEDLEKRKAEGVIYTSKLDLPLREFTEGFPGVTDRFEWFGLLYTGVFHVKDPGTHRFRMHSDDGSRLWIDGEPVIENDGVHVAASADGEVKLGKGSHSMKVWYFQGPPTEIALQLFITPPGADERIFDLADYAGELTAALRKVDAKATAEGIRIKLDAAILFDTGKWSLKPAAQEAIAAVAEVIASYPGSTVRVEGHTDAQGDDAANQKLSEKRADSVKSALASRKLQASFQAQGFGESRPAASNADEAGRALNRRVEVVVRP